MIKRSAGKDFQDFCRLPNSLLASFDMDFPIEPRPISSTIFRKCYFWLALLSHLYVFTFITKATLTMLTSKDFELSLLLRLISGFNYSFFSTAKCMTFCWNTKRYRKVYETLKEIYPRAEKDKLNFKIRDYFWPKWILFIVAFYLGVTAFIVASPFLESIIMNVVNVWKNGNMSADIIYHKLYEIDYSFDHRGLWRYFLTYSIEVLHAHLIIVFNMCGDIWLLCFTLQLCMHFDSIGRILESYQPDEKNALKDQEFIAEVVKKHQIILNLSRDINASFGLMLLLVLMSVNATLCCAGIYCLTQSLGRELFEYVAFLPTAVGQYFLVCYYGQLLIIKSQKVAEAAYNNNWYNGSHSYKKTILIILMRAQKAVDLNGLGLQSICLEAFQMIMGATYRMFALLKETML